LTRKPDVLSKEPYILHFLIKRALYSVFWSKQPYIFDKRDFNRHSNKKRLNFIKCWVQNLKPCVVVLLCCPFFKRDLYSCKRALYSTKRAVYSIKRALHSTFQSDESACSLHKRPVFYPLIEAALYFTKTALHYHQKNSTILQMSSVFRTKEPYMLSMMCAKSSVWRGAVICRYIICIYIYIYIYMYIYVGYIYT